jgi:pyruvate ferredoxin oxidoreductase beta subunit
MKNRYRDMLFVPGHRACPGCSVTVAVRAALEATGPNVIVVTPTGCLETFTSPYPFTPWGVPWVNPLFENGAAVASGIWAALCAKGQQDQTKVVVIGGDGGTHDIGLGGLSGLFERGDEVTYICYDNEAYMNTGVQSSGATPIGAATTTNPVGRLTSGKTRPAKNLASIAVAHGARYVATASVAFPADITSKVRRALGEPGAKFIHVHSPCPVGWGFAGSLTIEVARIGVQTGLVPIIEMVDGELVSVRRLAERRPVATYLRLQGRFKHLFEQENGNSVIEMIQELADGNARKYGLDLSPLG